MQDPENIFDQFRALLNTGDKLVALRDGVIGHDQVINGPYGPKKLVYTDYVASGRALMQIEAFLLRHVLPFYANSHTEASYTGGMMTRLRRQAREIVRAHCNANADHAVVFAGAGATQGLNRLVHLFGIKNKAQAGESPLVILGPYEHHSNILPWRESGAEVFELPEAQTGGPCLHSLKALLGQNQGRPILGAFSAASNVTGVLTDVVAVTRVLKAAEAHVIWDYAGGAPYLPIDMCPAPDALIDAVVFSAHKFLGGPQASGVMVLRRDAVETYTPSLPGGGTVRFVSPNGQDYAPNPEVREEAGTPNIVGDLRTALCLLVKQAIGQDFITTRNAHNHQKALAAWSHDPNIELLGKLDCPRLPIFSFRFRDGTGGFMHQQLATRMLSDRYGIQARGGCACAGPYAHRLLSISPAQSELLREAILADREIEKPGFVRLNLSFLTDDAEIDFIIKSVSEFAATANECAKHYSCNLKTAVFSAITV
jgi:selenocysteine lyase/cysteine desulfurase